MGFLRALKELLESIFMSSSPEVKKRTEMRKIENELKVLPSQIFKNGLLQPNFAEIFRVLYENTKPIDDILCNTINSEDLQRNGRFEYELIITGFDADSQEKFESLDYENRKREIMDSNAQTNKLIETQKRTLENLLKQLSAPGFMKIDDTLSSLKQLSDICHFNYINIIRIFDQDFDGLASTAFNMVVSASPQAVAPLLQDFGQFSHRSWRRKSDICSKANDYGAQAFRRREKSDFWKFKKDKFCFYEISYFRCFQKYYLSGAPRYKYIIPIRDLSFKFAQEFH